MGATIGQRTFVNWAHRDRLKRPKERAIERQFRRAPLFQTALAPCLRSAKRARLRDAAIENGQCQQLQVGSLCCDFEGPEKGLRNFAKTVDWVCIPNRRTWDAAGVWRSEHVEDKAPNRDHMSLGQPRYVAGKALDKRCTQPTGHERVKHARSANRFHEIPSFEVRPGGLHRGPVVHRRRPASGIVVLEMPAVGDLLLRSAVSPNALVREIQVAAGVGRARRHPRVTEIRLERPPLLTGRIAIRTRRAFPGAST